MSRPLRRRALARLLALAPPDLPLYDRKLSVAEVKHRIDTYYTPYHATLKAALDATHAAFGCATCHVVPAALGAPGHLADQGDADVRLAGLATALALGVFYADFTTIPLPPLTP